MRILGVHAEYATRGGEDVSHESEMAMLEHSGHHVERYTARNVEFADRSRPAQAAGTVFNWRQYQAISRKIQESVPDVAYINNTFPAISAAVLAACRKNNLPIIQVLRNYRFACVAGSLYRDGQGCTECVGKIFPSAGIRHKCYRASGAASLVASGNQLAIRTTVKSIQNIRYIAVSDYVRENFVLAGGDPNSVSVRSNLVWPEPELSVGNYEWASKPIVAFAGRDTPEKGLGVLLEAFRSIPRIADSELHVAGTSRSGASPQPGVKFHGSVTQTSVLDLFASSRCVVVPSVWPEPFGRVVVEALAVGTPVLVSRTGGLGSLCGEGVLGFESGSSIELRALLLKLLQLPPSEYEDLRKKCRQRYLRDFSSKVWLSHTNRVLEGAVQS